MTETEIKDLLDPLVGQNERHFTVVFTPRRTRRRLGSYTASLRRITIYEGARLDGSELIATALHELAHHLVWVYQEELMTEWRERKRFPSHGRRFKQMLASLLDAFNRVYAERFQGILVLDNREPRYAPRFVQFQEDITSVEDLIAYDKAVNKLLRAIFNRPSQQEPSEALLDRPEIGSMNESLQGRN